MIPTRIIRASHVHKPMIHFLGSRKNLEHTPHPAAPADIVEDFQSFLAKLQSSSGGANSPSSTPKGQSTDQSAKGKTPDQTGAGSSSSSGSGKSDKPAKPSKPADFDEFYEAPRYYWQQREFSEREIEAIMVGVVS